MRLVLNAIENSFLVSLLYALPLYILLYASAGMGAEKISLTGTLQAQVCIQSCGTCCGTHNIKDSSSLINLQVGNAFIDLSKVSDDDTNHRFSGYFYATTGQCGVGQCTLFAVETLDQPLIATPSYQTATGRLSIQAIVIDGNDDEKYAVTLKAPFTIDTAVDYDELETIAQGGDCSAGNAVCSSGTVCIAYFGIAGPAGPEFTTCEIPCSHPGASCPSGQSCVTIADGPGQVCTLD